MGSKHLLSEPERQLRSISNPLNKVPHSSFLVASFKGWRPRSAHNYIDRQAGLTSSFRPSRFTVYKEFISGTFRAPESEACWLRADADSSSSAARVLCSRFTQSEQLPVDLLIVVPMGMVKVRRLARAR